jgi:hypothetical protein
LIRSAFPFGIRTISSVLYFAGACKSIRSSDYFLPPIFAQIVKKDIKKLTDFWPVSFLYLFLRQRKLQQQKASAVFHFRHAEAHDATHSTHHAVTFIAVPHSA